MRNSTTYIGNSEENAIKMLNHWLNTGVMPFEHHIEFSCYVSNSESQHDFDSMAFIQDFIDEAENMGLKVIFPNIGDTFEILTADDLQRQHYEDLAAQFGYDDAA